MTSYARDLFAETAPSLFYCYNSVEESLAVEISVFPTFEAKGSEINNSCFFKNSKFYNITNYDKPLLLIFYLLHQFPMV
jgi:hypothetical protein